jgi:hypothetical protein
MERGHVADYLPASAVFCDVETTGFGHLDRIVSFGGIGMISRDLAKGRPDLEYLYLVFDPVGAATATPNGFMASRFRLCACKMRSQFMLPTYGAS